MTTQLHLYHLNTSVWSYLYNTIKMMDFRWEGVVSFWFWHKLFSANSSSGCFLQASFLSVCVTSLRLTSWHGPHTRLSFKMESFETHHRWKRPDRLFLIISWQSAGIFDVALSKIIKRRRITSVMNLFPPVMTLFPGTLLVGFCDQCHTLQMPRC